MENVNKAVVFLAVIDTMLDVFQGVEVDQSELIDALVMLGFNPAELLYDTPILKAFQIVSKAFSELELVDGE